MACDQSSLPPRSIVTVPGDRAEIRIHHQLRSQGAGPQFGVRQVQVILLFQNVVGELVRHGHADAARISVVIDNVDAGHLGLFASVFRIGRHQKLLPVRPQRGPAAFVEPLRRDSDRARRGLSPLEARQVHPHAVRHLRGVLMHRRTVVRAGLVGEPGPAHQAARRLGMPERRQQPPIRLQPVHGS